MLRRLAVVLAVTALVQAAIAQQQKQAEPFKLDSVQPGQWVSVGPSGGSVGGATVYSPVRKQVIRFGGLSCGNDVRALDLSSGQWSSDYAPDKCNVGGNFYGGQSCAGWIPEPGRPGAFFLFRQACWDSSRNRMVAVMLNLTAAYDSAAKSWTDLQASFDDGQTRTPGAPPAGYKKPWFAPVPGQWGSAAYDAVNDQIVLFPLWVTHLPEGPERPIDAGVPAGHYGTFVYDCKTSTWTRPTLGSPEMLALRVELEKAIDAQRLAAQAAFEALVAQRSENAKLAADKRKTAAEAQQTVNARLAAFKASLAKASFNDYQADQVKAASANLGELIARGEQAGQLLAAADGDLTKINGLQQATYRGLRLIRDEDLYVQPLPRCSTSVVYDPKNKVIVMAGGTHLDHLLSDTWLYDCQTRRWRRAAAAPAAANWPGMCYDAKRGLVIYAAENATYGYDAAKDQWVEVGPARPRGVYCDAAYDPENDLVVLNVSNNKSGRDEATFVLRPNPTGGPVAAEVAPRETLDETPFPPPATAEAVARIKSMPANTWVRANPNIEPTHRSWSTMSYDPALRCVIYQGGGHAGTMDNTVSAYFPESNTWVNAFKTQFTTRIFGSWSCAGGMPAFERGVGCSFHARWYESYAGQIVYGGQSGFDWATRERPAQTRLPIGAIGPRALHPSKPLLVGIGPGQWASSPTNARFVRITDVTTGEEKVHQVEGEFPNVNCEWSGLAVHPDVNKLFLHGAGDSRKNAGNETWTIDLANPTKWEKIELASTTPDVGMAKLNAIPGTDYLVCAMASSNDLWVYSISRKAWKVLPTDDGDDKNFGKRRFDIYGQCVWDPHNKVLVMVGIRGGYETRYTFLLRPDFDKIQW